MKTYKISTSIINFIENSIKEWKTDLKLYHANGMNEIPNVQIKRGIFQGDSLSPLQFVLELDPLSRLLNKMQNK